MRQQVLLVLFVGVCILSFSLGEREGQKSTIQKKDEVKKEPQISKKTGEEGRGTQRDPSPHKNEINTRRQKPNGDEEQENDEKKDGINKDGPKAGGRTNKKMQKGKVWNIDTQNKNRKRK